MPKPDAQLTPVQFLPGVREDVRQLAPVGSLARAENVRFFADKVSSRNGSIAVAPSVVGSSHEIQNSNQGIGFLSRAANSNMLGIDGDILARDDLSGAFVHQGAYSTCRPRERRRGFPAGPGKSFVSGGVAVNADGYIFAFGRSGASTYCFIEAPNGTRLYANVYPTSNQRVRVLAQGSSFVLVTQSGTSIDAATFVISAATGNVSSITVNTGIATLTSSSAYWDASAYDSGKWFLAWQDTATNIKLGGFTNGSVSITAVNAATVTGTCPISVWGDSVGARVWLGWVDDPTVIGAVRYRGYTVSGSSVSNFVSSSLITSAPNIYGPPLFGSADGAAASNGVGTCTAFYIVQSSNTSTAPFTRGFLFGWLDGSGATEASFQTGYHATPISKPDLRGRVWCVTGNQATNWKFQRVVLLRFRHAVGASNGVAGNTPVMELSLDEDVQPLTLANMPSGVYDYFHAVALGTHTGEPHYFIAPRTLQQGPGSNEIMSLDLVAYVPAESEPWRCAVESGLYTALVTGQPIVAHGLGSGARINSSAAQVEAEIAGAHEVGFAYRPAVLNSSQVAAGNLTALGAYQWVFCFEWTDAIGQRHRSAPSIPFSLTLTGGNQQVTFSIAGLEWHQIGSQQVAANSDYAPVLVCYRTVAGGTDFYRESVPTVAAYVSAIGTSGIVTYTSGNNAAQTDANIQSSEVVYTAGGVLSNALAPASTFGCRTEERLALGGGFDGRILTLSKIIVPGEPVQFSASDAFKVLLPEPCTALAYQDGTIVAFSQRAIYAVNGDGPNDQGVGLFSPPRLVVSGIGCIDFRSVLVTDVGIFFQGERGIYLLPRGLGQPQLASMPIEVTTAAYPYCLGAISEANYGGRTARFLVSNTRSPASGAQRVLTLDLELNAWAVDSYSKKLQAIGFWIADAPGVADPKPAGAVLGLSDLSSSNICAYWDTGTQTRDAIGGTPEDFTRLIETNPIRPWGMAGWGVLQDLILLYSATSGSPDLSMSLYQDGAFAQTVNWVPGTSAEESYKQLTPQETKGSAMRLRVTMGTSGSGYASFHGFQISGEALGERRTTSTERA